MISSLKTLNTGDGERKLEGLPGEGLVYDHTSTANGQIYQLVVRCHYSK